LFAEIYSEGIKQAARREGGDGSWTRRRDMPLHDMLCCTLGKKGLSTEIEVRQYFQGIGEAERRVSKQDYLRQRQKLNPEVFKVLNRNYLKRFYEGPEPKGWAGYLVFDVDGSRAEIPNSVENREAYGESKNQHGQGVARADLSMLYDVYNHFIIDIAIGRYNSGEIAETKAHITALKDVAGGRPVLMLFDRNYASLEFIDILEKAGIQYLMRVQSGAYKAELGQMGADDEEVELAHTKERLKAVGRADPERLPGMKDKKSTRARAVKAVFDDGTPAVFITSLREGSAADIQRLYRERWKIEQKYHTLKNKMKFESVTGKASIYVEQDFWAQTLVFNIIQDLITAAEIRVAKKAAEKKYRYEVRVNENIAIGLFKEQFIRLVMEGDDGRKDAMLRRLMSDMGENIVPVRKLKSSPRRERVKNKYKCNQKPAF
jgi:hypothetical protein